jgi:hypothetical protein
MGILYVPYPGSFCHDYYWCNGNHKYVYIICYTCNLYLYKENLLFVLVVGSVGDPASPGSFGGWLSYTATNHSWVVSFLIMDSFLFFGVITLTVIQASQVYINLGLIHLFSLFLVWSCEKSIQEFQSRMAFFHILSINHPNLYCVSQDASVRL